MVVRFKMRRNSFFFFFFLSLEQKQSPTLNPNVYLETLDHKTPTQITIFKRTKKQIKYQHNPRKLYQNMKEEKEEDFGRFLTLTSTKALRVKLKNKKEEIERERRKKGKKLKTGQNENQKEKEKKYREGSFTSSHLDITS